MNTRPYFLRGYGWPTTRKYPRTMAEAFPQDHANPIEHPSPRSWLWNDRFIAALLVAVLTALLLGACGGGDADEGRDASIGPVDCRAHPELCK